MRDMDDKQMGSLINNYLTRLMDSEISQMFGVSGPPIDTHVNFNKSWSASLQEWREIVAPVDVMFFSHPDDFDQIVGTFNAEGYIVTPYSGEDDEWRYLLISPGFIATTTKLWITESCPPGQSMVVNAKPQTNFHFRLR